MTGDQIEMLVPAVTGVVIMGGAGWLICIMAARGANGKLRRNPLMGIRTAATQASDEAWAAAHIASEKQTRMGGVGAIVAGLLSSAIALLGVFGIASADVAAPFSAGAVLAGAAWLVAWALRATVVGNRAARAAEQERIARGA